MAINVIDEQYTAKVAAVFNTEAEARAASEELINEGHFSGAAVNIVTPNDDNLSEKIEPESKGIVQTFMKSHGILGVVGLLAGLIAASILVAAGPVFTQDSPMATYFTLGFVGLFIGMMVAGIITLRPDHDPLIIMVINASQNQQWTVVVQTKDQQATNLAKQILQNKAEAVRETI
ncbi:MAG TPA: hypothetical protein VFM76_05780 [Methylophaga sp.]|nr:hypothetical protein [Methylophaga sp.]